MEMNTFKNGNNIEFWTWFYTNEFKNNIEFFGAGKRDYKEELKKVYNELLNSKDYSLKNIDNEDFYIRHSANGLIAQLEAIENILGI